MEFWRMHVAASTVAVTQFVLETTTIKIRSRVKKGVESNGNLGLDMNWAQRGESGYLSCSKLGTIYSP